ncbi:TPA: type I toxin-antitoxin system Fst family toxin [Enterococcus faecium]
MLKQIISLIVTPTIVGIVIELFSYWLDKKDDD